MTLGDVGAGEVAATVQAAASGCQDAWHRLVARYANLVWGVARGHGLSSADAADVCQTTWLRLAEHLNRLRDPERVGAWLATTARNEALRVLRWSQRHPTVAAVDSFCIDQTVSDVDERLLREEEDAAVWRAFASLSGPCKLLLRTLVTEPALSYAEVSEMLGMPVGSIGPTRGRCLQRLRAFVTSVTPSHTGAESASMGRATA